jgi:type I restriction enzyme S subunit
VPSQNLDTVTIGGKLGEVDLLRKGDILTVRSNGNVELIGRCLVAGEVRERISHSAFTIRIRLLNGDVLPEYLCHFMKCSSSKKRLIEAGIGTNIKSLNQQTLSALGVPFPSVSHQKAIVATLESISAKTQQLEDVYRRKLAALVEFRESLLHQAFTGAL